MTPPPPVLVDAPVLLMTRAEATWLVLLPLNRLLASTPFSEKLLLVSLCPFAQMGGLPRPESDPEPPGSSALSPGDRIAAVKGLPVGSGIDSIWVLSSTYPFVVSTAFISGTASTLTTVFTAPTFNCTFSVPVRSP